jgi:cation diffusion facilitator family transporter
MLRLKEIRRVLIYTLILNIAVATAKIFYGYITNSISMLSDGFHSFFDGSSNVIGLIGTWIASKPPDENHPYGHRKFETLATIAIAVLIFGAGIEILREAYSRIKVPPDIEVTFMSFLIMAVTLTVNIGVMSYEIKKGRKLKSDFLLADAMHTKTDIYISLSVIISLIAVKIGYPVIDVIAAFVITVFIAKMGFSILKSATAVLTDTACIDPEKIEKTVNAVKGVRGCHEIRTRGYEDFISVDLHLLVDPEATAQEAHDLAHSVEEAIKKEFVSIKDVIIHIEPYQK